MLKAESGSVTARMARDVAGADATPRSQEASIWLVMLAPVSFALNLLAIIYLRQ